MPHFLVGTLVLLLVLCHSTPASSSEKLRKWVPHTYLSEPGGVSVPIMVLEDIDTACADHSDPEECRRLWEKIPPKVSPIGRSEVTYLADLGKGLQLIRMSRSSHCTIMQEPGDETPCHTYWWYFVRKKIREEI